ASMVREMAAIGIALDPNAPVKEMLIEATARNLANEGFGADSMTFAEQLWNLIEQAFLRMAMAVQRMLMPEGKASEVLAQRYFENKLKQLIGADYSIGLNNLLGYIGLAKYTWGEQNDLHNRLRSE